MRSECARFTPAAEARVRVDGPNSKPRSIPVIALDAGCERVLKALREGGSGAAFFGVTSRVGAVAARDVRISLRDIGTGATKDLGEVLMSAQHVVIVVTAGEDAEMASIIGEGWPSCSNGCTPTRRPLRTSAVKAPQWELWL